MIGGVGLSTVAHRGIGEVLAFAVGLSRMRVRVRCARTRAPGRTGLGLTVDAVIIAFVRVVDRDRLGRSVAL